jgi:hypothetical protein
MKLSNIQIERLRQSASRPGRLRSDSEQQGERVIVKRPENTTRALGHETLPTTENASSKLFPTVTPALVDVKEATAGVEGRPISRHGPNWKLPLCRAITPIGGVPMYTLADVRDLIAELPKGTRQQEAWDRAADRLIKAAESGRDTEIEAATFNVEWALFLEQRLQ